jgi:hypothetical protein
LVLAEPASLGGDPSGAIQTVGYTVLNALPVLTSIEIPGGQIATLGYASGVGLKDRFKTLTEWYGRVWTMVSTGNVAPNTSYVWDDTGQLLATKNARGFLASNVWSVFFRYQGFAPESMLCAMELWARAVRKSGVQMCPGRGGF